MSTGTSIEWTDATWSPLRARRRDTGKVGQHCERVSPGCANCYAATHNRRNLPHGGTGLDYVRGSRDLVETFVDERVLVQPLRWREPKKVFVCNQTDLFADFYSDEQRDRVFAVMALAPRHTFQLLTKRPERMREYLLDAARDYRVAKLAVQAITNNGPEIEWGAHGTLPSDFDCRAVREPPNVWLGVTAEDQQRADERIPILLDTPAAVRFVSAEPLLGQVDLGLSTATCDCCPRWSSRWVRLHRPVGPDMPTLAGARADQVADCGVYRASSNKHGALSVQTPGGLLGIRPSEFDALPGLDWVIVGGESGAKARAFDIEWARSIRKQCAAAGTAFFFKQAGAHVVDRNDRFDTSGSDVPEELDHWPDGTECDDWHLDLSRRYQGAPCRILLRDPKGGDLDELPPDMRVREFPREVR